MVKEFKSFATISRQVKEHLKDASEDALGKRILTFLVIAESLACIYWIWTLSGLGEGYAIMAAAPYFYMLISYISLFIFYRTKRYEYFVFVQILLLLILPFFMQWVIGGFTASSGIAAWAILSPIGALMIRDRHSSTIWFILFVILMMISQYLDSTFAASGMPIPAHIKKSFFMINMAGLSTVIYLAVRYFQSQKQGVMTALEYEQTRSEKLLLNILPEKIAARLKESDSLIADRHEYVTIMFADLVNFTELSAKMEPSNLVYLLNQVFSKFDALTEKYDLEKIKTMGDAYMVVGGLLNHIDDHAIAVAAMALEMGEALNEVAAMSDIRLQMRVGINSGPVVAGVIGSQKFTYDLWGDSVNIASRMERSAAPDAILVSESSYDLLKDEFIFQEPQLVELKGKGQAKAYRLVGKK